MDAFSTSTIETWMFSKVLFSKVFYARVVMPFSRLKISGKVQLNPLVPIRTRSLCIGILLSCFGMMGCLQEEEIVRYEIPKDRSDLEHLRESAGFNEQPPAEQSAVSKEKDRMIVALALRDDASWFFKLNGPVSRIDETEDQWRPFLEKISFDESGKPKWDLPEGWTTAGPKPMRFATLVVESENPTVEIAVSSLSAGQDLLLNVNRWRGQLGLDPTTEAGLKDSLTTIQAGDQELKLFDATGKMSGGMMPPFAKKRPFAKPSGNANSLKLKSASNQIKFTAPEGWQAGQPSPFLKARFSRTDADQTVQISVSSLPAAANKWIPNAKRWAGQVGMDSLDDTKLTELTEAVSVDGVDGKLIRLIPEADEGDKATIATMVVKGSNAWFFKLTGDRDLVTQSDQVLVEFMKTVKLP